MEGAGVGNGGGNSGAIDTRLVREGAVLCRLRGDARFAGDEGTSGVAVSSGSNICDGSTSSPVFVLRVLEDLAVPAVTSAIVLRRLPPAAAVDFLGLFLGAGVNSSSSS